MAISVNNISPEKLTSLLNWFKTNADDLYAKGSAGAKNVLDNALTRVKRPIPFDYAGAKGTVLNDAFENMVHSTPQQLDYNTWKIVDNSFDNALYHSRYSIEPGDPYDIFNTAYTRHLDAAFPPLTNPEALARGDYFSTVSPVPLPKEILTPQTQWMYGMRPHKNTALNKWFESQFKKQRMWY